MEAREPITLTDGTVVKHRPLPNGAQEAFIDDGKDEMTEFQWQEYCLRLVHRTKAAMEAREAKLIALANSGAPHWEWEYQLAVVQHVLSSY